MRLQLARPLVFFDLETTGVDIAKDRIVEISMVKLFPDSHRESLTYRVNPEMHIPEGASEVHHIYDDDVRDCPTFAMIVSNVLDYIRDCDLAGYNSNHFDVPMLQEEILRVGQEYDLREHSRFVDAFVIFQKHTPRNLTAAYMHYCGKELVGAHGANADTEATCDVLMAQMEQHADLPTDIASLSAYTTQQEWADLAGKLGRNAQGEPTFNFGKNKGRTLREIFGEMGGSGYYSWFMEGDFPLYTKRICQRVMDDLKAERRAERQTRQEHDHRPATEEQIQGLINKINAGRPSNGKRRNASRSDEKQMSLF